MNPSINIRISGSNANGCKRLNGVLLTSCVHEKMEPCREFSWKKFRCADEKKVTEQKGEK